MSCLQQLCSLLPFNPWHWHGLGQMCLQLLGSKRTTSTLLARTAQGFCFTCAVGLIVLRLAFVDLCSSQWGETAEGDEEEEEDAAEFGEDRMWLKACTCFIRTRYL